MDEPPVAAIGQVLVELTGDGEEVLMLVFENTVLTIEGHFIVYESERVIQ